MKRSLWCLLACLLCCGGMGFGAVAIDAASWPGTDPTNSTSYSWSHTVTGTNVGLQVCVAIVDSGGTSSVSGITYNSVSLTLVKRQTGANSNATECWRLYAPATGTHTIVVTLAAAPTQCSISGAVSLSGVDQSAGVEANSGGTGASGTNPSDSVTTIADNDFVVDAASDNHPAGAHGVGASQTIQVDQTCSGGVPRGILMSSKGPITPAGSTTMSETSWGDAWTHVLVAWKASGGGSTPKSVIVGGGIQ